MKAYKVVAAVAIVSLVVITAFVDVKHIIDEEQAKMHFAYDDSTLTNRVLPVMMPYNRLIEPAGKTISFGDPNFEEHSLTAKLLPGISILAVEERFGIALID